MPFPFPELHNKDISAPGLGTAAGVYGPGSSKERSAVTAAVLSHDRDLLRGDRDMFSSNK